MTKGTKLLRMIVFDLDCTLWPFHVDLFKFAPPYSMKDGQVVDRYGAMMQTFPETRNVLEHYSKECTIGIASRTTYPQGAMSLLKLFDLEKYITHMEIYPGDKSYHFRQFVQKTGFQAKEMLLFDDEERNVRDVSKLGVKCILVDSDVGVTRKLVDEAIDKNFVDPRKN